MRCREGAKASLRREKTEWLKQQPRFEKIDVKTREREVEDFVCQEIARREVPPFEKWYMRRQGTPSVAAIRAGCRTSARQLFNYS